ncbi:MAG: hypothetical protein AABX90_00020, partial [Nanoarchaeota archaeon]
LFKRKSVPELKPQKRRDSFPEFPKYESSLPEIPKYESALEDFPKFKSLPRPEFPKPQYQKNEQFEIPRRMPDKIELLSPEKEEFYPRMLDQFNPMPSSHQSPSESNQIFVKLSDYRKSLNNLREIKRMLDEAEKLMADIQRLKSEEDKQLSQWQQEINEVKSKLMDVDKDLFEYQ